MYMALPRFSLVYAADLTRELHILLGTLCWPSSTTRVAWSMSAWLPMVLPTRDIPPNLVP